MDLDMEIQHIKSNASFYHNDFSSSAIVWLTWLFF